MATNRDTIQLVIDILGQAGLEQLAKAAEDLRAKTRAAADTYEVLDTVVAKSGGIVGTYDVIIEKTTVELARERAALDELRAAQDRYNAELEEHNRIAGVSIQDLGRLAASTEHEAVALDHVVRKAVEATAAQRALGRALDEGVATPAGKAERAVAGLVGGAGKGGRGLLGASYAVQDFTSVLTGGGGLARAMGAVTNNVDQLAMAAGASVATAAKLSLAFTGFAAAIPLLTPLFESLWKSIAGGTEDADANLKSFRESLDKTRGAVAEINQESNQRVAALVRERDALQAVVDKHNEQIAAVKKLRGLQAAGTTEREHERAANLQALVGGKQGELVGEVAAGMATPGQRAGRTRSRREIESQIEGWRRNLAATPENDVAARANLERLIAGGRRRLASLDATEADERRRAEGLVAGAVVGGRAGDLDEVLGRLPADSRFRGALAGQTNGALDRGDDEARAFDDHIERVQEATKERNERARREKRDAAAKKARDARDAREAKAAGKAGHRAGTEHQADELLAHGPEIVGQAFGPQAAAMAANANPAEVGEIKARTMKNLEEGQAPYAALLEAFREVGQAAARNAEETRRFAGQLNGVRGRINPSSESPANFITN